MLMCSFSQLDEEASVWSPGPAQGRVQFRLPAPQATLRPDGPEVAAYAHHIQVGVGEDDDVWWDDEQELCVQTSVTFNKLFFRLVTSSLVVTSKTSRNVSRCYMGRTTRNTFTQISATATETLAHVI